MFQYECLKNPVCVGYAYKPPATNTPLNENCNILDDIANENIETAQGWTLYKCNCCNACDTCCNHENGFPNI